MWMLLLLVVITSAADEGGWAYALRFNIGPVSFNFFLITLTVAFLVAVFRGGAYMASYPTDRKHPLFATVLLLFAAAFASGSIGLMLTDPTLVLIKEVGFGVRDFMALPISIFIGYRLLATPRSAERFAHVMVVGGVVVSIALILSFGAKAQTIGTSSSINEVRTTRMLADVAGLACALVLFSMASGTRLYRPWLAAIIASICLIGQVSPLHRSSWLACAVGLVSILTILPRQRRLRSALVGVSALLVLACSLWVGMYLASQFTGWNFYAKMQERVVSLLPGERYMGEQKAWDTRIGGALQDLGLFATSPVFGRGFGIQEYIAGTSTAPGAHHNAWTDIMAKTGLLGLIPALLVIGGSIVIGRRMVHEQVDRGSILLGALGVITGFYYLTLGMATWSFNSLRGGICLGVTFGVLLRCRAMQLTSAAVWQEEPQFPVGALDELQPPLVPGL